MHDNSLDVCLGCAAGQTPPGALVSVRYSEAVFSLPSIPGTSHLGAYEFRRVRFEPALARRP